MGTTLFAGLLSMALALLPGEAEQRARLQAELDAWRAEVKAPGAVAAVAWPDREREPLVAASGLARKVPAQQMPLDGRFFSGSIGKVVVATVALQLVQEGVVTLDAPIAAWLRDEEWFARLPNHDALRVSHLLNHTSGLPEYFDQPGALAKLRDEPQAEWSVADRLDFVLDRQPLFAAGEGWSYADTNYIVLGALLEAASGEGFYERAERTVLGPLGLAETTPSLGARHLGLVSGYTTPGRPFPFPAEVAVDGVYCANCQFEWTGGGYVTTPRDLARLAAGLWGSDALLPVERRAEMTRGVAAKLTPGERYGFGCTLRDVKFGATTTRAIGHSGWFPGYLSDMAYFEGAGCAVAVQVNTDQGVGLGRLHGFLDRVAAALAPEELAAPATPAAKDESPSAPAEKGAPSVASPAASGAARVDAAALDTLRLRALQAKSDALWVQIDGEPVAAEYFNTPRTPIELMSCTKSVINLLIGMLIDDGKIASVDEPVTTWFPEFVDAPAGAPERAGGAKLDAAARAERASVTLLHLLTHTSGLAADATTEKIYASPDFVKFAVESALQTAPGTAFFYNNVACNLVAGIIEKASGQKADDFARERLFEPLGITEFGWTRDATGNPHGMAGCQLHAEDLARIGQLVLQRGVWEGERLISEAWLDASMRPAFPQLGGGAAICGRLWWLDLAPATGEMAARVRAIRADGFLGNYLVVVPSTGLVAVRQRRFPANQAEMAEAKFNFTDFLALAQKVVPAR